MFKHVNSKSEIENMQIKLNIMEEKLDKVLEITIFFDIFFTLSGPAYRLPNPFLFSVLIG